MKSGKIFFIAFIFFTIASCHKVQIIRPPEGGGSVTFSGKGEFKSNLLVENRIPTSNTNPSDDETLLVGNDVGQYFSSTDFGKPSNPSKLPFLKSNAVAGLTLQLLPSDMKVVSYPGAFGTAADPEWNIASNWFKINPYDMEYQGQSTAEVLQGEINSNRTLTANKTYLLRGQVFVNSGATLTIEPGTIIFGDGKPSDGILCINRGGKLIARGTAERPIVFTSSKAGKQRQRGDWGGIVICGRAPNNKGTDVLVEGIQTGSSGDGGKYGGNIPADNSGEISYVRVEFAGIAVTPGNEVNGITFGSVGSATKVDHVIVSVGGDDGLEWFGGSVNARFVGLYDILDDDLDMDAGYTGNIQFIYSLRNPFAADESLTGSLEITSSKTAGSIPGTAPVIANMTSVGPIYLVGEGSFNPNHEGGARVSADARPKIVNNVFIGWPRGLMNY
jgi:hypothetical protein